MPMEKAEGLVLRATDWSETSRIVTLWTREHGRVRALAKGGRRARSNFENALDLLTVCSIVLLRKSSGALDLLTEARVVKRFSGLTNDLMALYGGYYVAELLSEHTEDNDPHPELYDAALKTLEKLGDLTGEKSDRNPARDVLQLELLFLDSLGYRPAFESCTQCGTSLGIDKVHGRIAFSAQAGGALCARCRQPHRDQRWVTPEVLRYFQALSRAETESGLNQERKVEVEARRVMSQYITWHLGRRPRLLPYLEQGI